MVARVPHKVLVGTTSVGVYLLDEYQSIGSVVGVTKITDTDLPALSGTVKDLVGRGSMARLRIGYELSGGKRKYANIVCDLDKVKSAVSALPGKAFKSGVIKSAFFAQRRRLG